MKYFRVQCGDYGFIVNPNFTLLNGELLTSKEVEKLKVPKSVLEEVFIPKSKVYTSFGMRKEIV